MPEKQFQQLIYFPRDTPRIPAVVYLVERVNLRYWQVASRERHARQGWGNLVEACRLIPYTDSAWAACQAYVQRRDRFRSRLRSEYNALLAGQQQLLIH